MGEEVTISRQEYLGLLESRRWLDALEAAGVDNWQGYDDAVDIYREEEEE